MSIPQAIFQRTRPDFAKFAMYGFRQRGGEWHYQQHILDGDFRVDITVSEDGEVNAKVIDSLDDREYANVNIAAQQGEFVNRVRDAYRDVLEEVRAACFVNLPFVFAQSNRLAKQVHAHFGDIPEPFMGNNAQAFKHASKQKWYGIIIHLPRHKITPTEDTDLRVDVLNVKVEREKIPDLLTQTGYYPAYHMNKTHWVSIILDDTVPDADIMTLLTQSHGLCGKATSTCRTEDGSKSWLIPANPKHFDVIQAFTEKETLTWRQRTNIVVGDTVYLYLGAPYSAILYQCQVLETDLPHENANTTKRMRIQRTATYEQTQFPLSKLKTYGVNAIRSVRSMPESLRNDLEKVSKRET